MDQELNKKIIKLLTDNNVSINSIIKDIKRKEKYRELQLKYNKNRYNKFNTFTRV